MTHVYSEGRQLIVAGSVARVRARPLVWVLGLGSFSPVAFHDLVSSFKYCAVLAGVVALEYCNKRWTKLCDS